MKKKLLLCIIFILFLWTVLIFFDSQRLHNQNTKKALLITIFESTKDHELIYYGLGYSIHYELDKNNTVIGATFYVFDHFVLWGWIE